MSDILGISLSRVSSKEQLLNHSLEAQDKNIEQMATSMGVTVVKTWTGKRSTRKGKNHRRKDLEEMLKYCRSDKRVKYVFVDKVDRLMREMKMLIKYVVEFEMIGVSIIFCEPSQQYLNGDGEMTQLFLMMEAFKAESDNKSRGDTSASRMKSRIALGYYLSYPHMCYRKSDTPGIHTPDNNFPIVQKGSRMILYEGLSPSEAVRWMNDNGFLSRKGERLDLANYISAMKSDYYCGKISIESEGWPKGVQGLHKPMFTEHEHKKLNTILSKRNPHTRLKHNPEYPLSNRLQHDICRGHRYDGRVCGFWHNKGKRPYGSKKLRAVYQCRNCKRYFLRTKVQSSFDELLSELKISNQSAYIKSLKRIWNTHTKLAVTELTQLKSQRSQIEQQERQIATAFALETDPLIKESLRSSLQPIAARRQELDQRISESEYGDDRLSDFIEFAIKKAENMRSTWGELSIENKKRCEQILFPDNFYVDDSATVHTPKISDIYRLANEKDDPKVVNSVNMVELPGTAPGSIR